jgi:hypothetical protein
MPPRGTNLEQAIQLIMMIRAMEDQQRAQQPQPQGANRVAGLAKKAKDSKEIFETIKGFGSGAGGASAVNSLGSSAGGMSSMGSSIPSVSGFSGMEEMLGNGLFSQAPSGMTASTAANPATLGGVQSLGSSGLSSIGSVALPIAAAAITANSLWESGGKDILRGRGDKADYTNLGLAAGTMGLSEMANMGLRLMGKRSLGAMMKSGKSGAQNQRDDFRSFLKQSGVADNDYNVKLADGSMFNVGLDGKTKYKNVGKNVDGGTERNAWDVDWSNPLAKQAVALVDPLVRKNFQDGNGVKPEQYTGMLVNAIANNAKSEDDVLNNMRSVFGSSEFGAELPGAAPSTPAPFQRPGRGQVARMSPGMYMNDRGQVVRSGSSQGAMKNSYQIPRTGRK